MPTIDVDYVEFEKLLGIKFDRDMTKVNSCLAFVKGEVKVFDEKEGLMSIEIKDSNRPDLWSIEGLVRALRGFLGLDEGLKNYTADKPIAALNVSPELRSIRPYIGCSIVKNVKLTDKIIRGLMHLQDKLDQTYGRNRRRTSIGLYDFSLLAPPFSYTVAKPSEIRFMPLGFNEKMSLEEILQKHPKGLEYGSILRGHSVYPILLDSERKVLSFPPIINSNDLGRINEDTKHLLIEVTGTAEETVLTTLKIVTLSLIDRGGKAYSTTIHYPHEKRKVVTPNFETRRMTLDVEYVNRLLGLQVTTKQIAGLLSKAGFDAEKTEKSNLVVRIPCYRVDVMHQIDLVEDVAIAYGYNNIRPSWRKLPTTGGLRPEQNLLSAAIDLMIGLGFQEILTYTMTNTENLFTKMNCKKEKTVEIANPKVQTLTCLRNWLLPSLIEFLSNNLSVDYPQRIFELGKITALDDKKETRTRDEEWLAAASSHPSAGFSEIKSALDAFFLNLNVGWQIKETKHPSFIDGRAGAIIISGKTAGILGEINPKVLTAWKIENPTIAFEVNMNMVVETKQAS
ncbi:phenylalanine--tRNA ligase subunit beta [Candidatus Bathyarchaeota archaeon]|nr:phenylalanine--tRNA ligase subunit beta [Candidatus Bathyarchaeota archaeon]